MCLEGFANYEVRSPTDAAMIAVVLLRFMAQEEVCPSAHLLFHRPVESHILTIATAPKILLAENPGASSSRLSPGGTIAVSAIFLFTVYSLFNVS